MTNKAALKVLEKEMEFLGLSMEKVLIMIERNPYAFPYRVIEAFKVYKESNA